MLLHSFISVEFNSSLICLFFFFGCVWGGAFACRNKGWLVFGIEKTLVWGENSSRDVASVTQKCLLLSDYI